MKETTNNTIKWIVTVALASIFALGIIWVSETYGEPDTALAFYRFQDNNKYAAHIQPESKYLNALENPKNFHGTNESTKFIIDNREKCSNITVKYSTTTEPVWTELGNFVDMGDNQYLIDCVKTYPDTTITYCISAKNKKGKLEEFYFSYVIR